MRLGQVKLIAVNDHTGVEALSDGRCVYLKTPGQERVAGPVPLARFETLRQELGFRKIENAPDDRRR